MINQQIRQLMMDRREKFMIPASLVATVNEDNSLYHAFLVLTKDHYAKIVVVDNESHYRGLLSLSMITDELLETDRINQDKLQTMKVRDVMQTDAPVITDPYDVEENLHLLIDQSFLTVVSEHGEFTGIVTRRELLKAVNYAAHTFDRHFEVLDLPETENV